MKRIGICLPWMALAATALGQQGLPAHVDFTYQGPAQGQAFRVGDDCYVSPAMVQAWEWQAEEETSRMFRVTVGDDTFEVGSQRLGGSDVLDLSEALRHLDAGVEWQKNTNTLEVAGLVRVVRLSDKHLSIDSSLPVRPHVTFLTGPNRVVVDLFGANLSEDAIVDVRPGLDVSEPKPGQVRIVATIDRPFSVDPAFALAATDFDLDTAPAFAQSVAPAQTPGQPFNETMTLDAETNDSLRLTMPLPSGMTGNPTVSRVDARTLRISLPGVQLQLSPDTKISSPSITSVAASITATGTDLLLALSRPMGVSISHDDGLHVRLIKPPVGNGKLAGKLIVVDAGHGGHDSGAKDLGSHTQEKDLTLAISKLLAEDLAAQGATVVMTRSTDVFVTLPERAAIANRDHADLFLCVHINSNGGDHTTAGSITFFHNQDPVCMTLADCIEREICKESGIAPIGIWSDTKIYRSGFAVLRGIKMPGVLMEMGFINNVHDRALLVKPDVQSKIAAGVVRGVQVYLGEDPTHEK